MFADFRSVRFDGAIKKKKNPIIACLSRRRAEGLGVVAIKLRLIGFIDRLTKDRQPKAVIVERTAHALTLIPFSGADDPAWREWRTQSLDY